MRWDKARLSAKAIKRSSQRHLLTVLRQIVKPDVELIEDYAHEWLIFPDSTQPITFDVYAPGYLAAFEYQGPQHYQDTMIFGVSEMYKGMVVGIIYLHRLKMSRSRR